MTDNSAKLLARVAVDALLKDVDPLSGSIEEYQKLVEYISVKCPRLLQTAIHLEGENVLSLGLIKWLTGIPTANSEIFFLSIRKDLEAALIVAAKKADDNFFN